MPSHRRLLLLPTALLVLGTPGPAAAAPSPGDRYDGESRDSVRALVRVSKNGARLADYFLGPKMRCTDDRRRFLALGDENEDPVRIGADGRFAYTSSLSKITYRRGRNLTGRVRVSFEGRLFGRREKRHRHRALDAALEARHL